MNSKAYKELLEIYSEISILTQIEVVLTWDQNTYMPRKAVEGRGSQLALVSSLRHKMLTSRKIGALLKELRRKKGLEPSQMAVVREIARDHDRRKAIPDRLVREMSKLEPISQQAWIKARKDNDYPSFKPFLKKFIDLKREVAERVGYQRTPYDALMDEYEPCMRKAEVQELFSSLRKRLVPIVKRISESGANVDESIAQKGYPIDLQERFSKEVLSAIGYDFERGRLDVTAHPFTIGSNDDVRVTTRFDERDLRSALFSSIHEGGHALYEQGFLRENHNTPLAEAVSYGIHESQSRLWENMVGRSLPFWKHFLPRLRGMFPNMKGVSLERFHRAVNVVKPSLIRVEADEVTYALHVMVRFDIESGLIEGKLDAGDVPEVWNDSYSSYLGLEPESDSNGCLQDVHWSVGYFGYFPTYALGNLYAAQFFDRAKKDVRGLEEGFERGEFGPLLSWLRKNIHSKGKLLSAPDLVKEVTGGPLDEEHFLHYIKEKYSRIYDINL